MSEAPMGEQEPSSAGTPDEMRRRLVRTLLVTPVALALPGLLGGTFAAGDVAAAPLVPTPACGDDDDEPTPRQTEGPYFTPNSPKRTSLLEPGMTETHLVVSGM